MTDEIKNEFELTPELIRLYTLLVELNEAKEIVSKPYGFFCSRKVDVEAIISVIRSYAKAKSDFWLKVSEVYPQLKNKDMTSDGKKIIINN